MALERQDVRARLDHDVHHALVAICDATGVTVAEFVERVLAREIQLRVHEAQAIASAVQRLGKSATDCDGARK